MMKAGSNLQRLALELRGMGGEGDDADHHVRAQDKEIRQKRRFPASSEVRSQRRLGLLLIADLVLAAQSVGAFIAGAV
jgi:hypothetical protein